MWMQGPFSGSDGLLGTDPWRQHHMKFRSRTYRGNWSCVQVQLVSGASWSRESCPSLGLLAYEMGVIMLCHRTVVQNKQDSGTCAWHSMYTITLRVTFLLFVAGVILIYLVSFWVLGTMCAEAQLLQWIFKETGSPDSKRWKNMGRRNCTAVCMQKTAGQNNLDCFSFNKNAPSSNGWPKGLQNDSMRLCLVHSALQVATVLSAKKM